MCALHDGQIVDVALPQTCCFRLHSKHSITELCCRFQKPSNLPGLKELAGAPPGPPSRTGAFRPGFAANGEKKGRHCGQIDLLPAASSTGLKPRRGPARLL